MSALPDATKLPAGATRAWPKAAPKKGKPTGLPSAFTGTELEAFLRGRSYYFVTGYNETLGDYVKELCIVIATGEAALNDV